MADNYTQFSVLLPIPKGKEEEAKLFLSEWFQQVAKAEEEEDWDFLEDHGGFEYDINASADISVWINSGESGNLEGVILFIKAYLTEMEIEGGIYMGWADTCSKLRVNEFGGGGVVITAEDHRICGSSDVRRAAFEAGLDVLN